MSIKRDLVSPVLVNFGGANSCDEARAKLRQKMSKLQMPL